MEDGEVGFEDLVVAPGVGDDGFGDDVLGLVAEDVADFEAGDGELENFGVGVVDVGAHLGGVDDGAAVGGNIDGDDVTLGGDAFDAGEVVGAVGDVEAEGEGALVAFAFFGEDFDGGVTLGLGGAVGLVGDVGDVVEQDGVGIGVGLDGDIGGLVAQLFGVEGGVGGAEEEC